MTIQLKEIRDLPNGARFYTADLHVHSFGGSHDIKDPAMTPEALIDQAVKDQVSILAITDHNSVANTQRGLDYARKYSDSLLMIAGIEVTTAHGHLLVYFAKESVASLNRFVARIGIVGEGTGESHTSMSMADVAREAASCGGLCIAAHIDREKTGFERLAPGYPNWKKDIITSPGIYGFEVDDAAHLVWYSDQDESTPAGAERRKLLEQRARMPGGSARAALAHVQNSDAHSLAAFAAAPGKRARTRVKMDALSFDGFRTALADAEARVRAVAVLPPAISRVLALHVDGGFLNTETLRLSDNMNCFIGGRGTGKSTALRCIAYALGADNRLSEYDNCPDSVVMYCEDAQGIIYRYERMRGSEAPEVRAKEAGHEIDVPTDSFRIEYYGQGDLARVAEDPLNKPRLLQEFLDRHTNLTDLRANEDDLLEQLRENGGQLRPLEQQAGTRQQKKSRLDELDKKLKLAEEGKLKEIAASQSSLGAERGLAKSLDDVRAFYFKGLSLKNFRRDYESIATEAGHLPGDAESAQIRASLGAIIDATNAFLTEQENTVNKRLKEAAKAIEGGLLALAKVEKEAEEALTLKIDALRKAGLTASLADLGKLIRTRAQLANDIAAIDQKAPELKALRADRAELLTKLEAVRGAIDKRRRSLVADTNRHLAKVIDDYTVVLVYVETGLVKQYFDFVRDAMRGSYLQEDIVRRFCAASTPQGLAGLVATRDVAEIAKIADIGDEWARQLQEQLSQLERLHLLQTIWKPACPTIRVLTKGTPTRQIPVNQLSDGQRHTIMLTIAMLAESDAPLVIDQPEDDLDNAFIFSSVVRILRTVKERRQVILVTHNANIAVLGDAELLFPMHRDGDLGRSFDRGSIDRAETKAAVQRILEGGEVAFLRRKEIYGH